MFTKYNLVFPVPKEDNKDYLKEVLNQRSIFLEKLRKVEVPLEMAIKTYASRIKDGALPAEVEGMAQVIREIEDIPPQKQVSCVQEMSLYFRTPQTETAEINETVFTYADGMTEKIDVKGYLTNKSYTSPFGRKLTDVVVGRHVIKIDYDAFRECRGLASIIIPDSVQQIGLCAFRGCNSLVSVTVPEGVKEIRNNTFADCVALTSVRLPDSIKTIGAGAFQGCSVLSSINIPDGITSIAQHTFCYCFCLKSIILPDSVMEIGQGAFQNCFALNPVNIPDNVVSIGNSAFSGCHALVSIPVPNSVIKIGEWAFASIPHIYYTGSATGAPWGALAIN